MKYLIVSGVNEGAGANEPEQMRADLAMAGVDPSIIYLDDGGIRTFDSMIRLRKVFSQDSVTIISQRFHNERALYIASHIHINAVGFSARDAGTKTSSKLPLREWLARVKVFWDLIFEK